MTTRSVRSGRLVTRAVGAAGVLCLLAGCSGGSAGNQAGPSTERPLIDAMPAAKGQVDQITWNLANGEPDTLDPANAAYYPSGTVVSNMCDSLLVMNPDFTYKPNLADYKVVSPTRIVWTIRDGATFWDGKPVTAEDVAWSMNRLLDPAKTLSFMYLNVASINVTGPGEVTVDFKQPDELFLKEMANGSGAVMEKAFSEQLGDKLGTAQGGVMCSGPFKFDSWRTGDSITLTRNDQYWNKDRMPLAKNVKFTFVTDATALTRALDSGEIDGGYETPFTAIPSLQKSSNGTLSFGPSVQTTAACVARPDGPLADIKLRDAMQLMIDRQSLAQKVYNGAAAPGYAIVSPPNWPVEAKAQYQAAYDKLKAARQFDPAKAQELVKASKYDGTPLVVAYQTGDEAMSRTAQLLQQQAKAAGITMTLTPLEPLVFTQALSDKTKRPGVDVLLTSSFNGAPDPNENMGFTILPGQPYNYTDYDNPDVTRLLDQSRSEFDPIKSAQLFIQAQDIFEQSSVCIPMLETNTVTFLNKRLTGATTSFAYWSMPSMAVIGSPS